MFANKYLNDIENSKDIVQEVFLNIWKKKIEFDNKKAVKAYMYSAVKNKSLDYLKSNYSKKKSNITIDDLKRMENDTFFYREVIVSEASEIIDAAIKTLPIKCGNIIKLSTKGFSNPQIAEKLSISINTVKTQKRIAYTKLRILLGKGIFLISLLFFLR